MRDSISGPQYPRRPLLSKPDLALDISLKLVGCGLAKVLGIGGDVRVKLRPQGVFMIGGRRKCGQSENKQHREELQRQHAQVEVKRSTLLEMRIEGDVTQEKYVAKRADFHDRQAALRVHLEVSDRYDRDIAELAIKAFEFSQFPKERWLTSDYTVKRTILSIMLESMRLNSEEIQFSRRKPFDLLRGANSVPLIGASGTPPIRSELSRQFPRAPAPFPSFGSSGACLRSQRGRYCFSPDRTSSDFGGPVVAHMILVTDLLSPDRSP